MAVDRDMPRIQEVLLPYFREQFPTVHFSTWYNPTDHRTFPFVNVRRLGGLPKDVRRLDFPVIELTAYTRDGLELTEDLYLDVRTALWDMVDKQIVTDAGYLHSYFETMGPTQFDSPFENSWRIQGLIQLGLRPPRN